MTDWETKSYNKDARQKVTRPLLAVLFAIIIIVSYSLYAERQGYFPGNIFNEWTVSNYIRSKYDFSNVSVRYSHYDKARGRYIYDCSGTLEGENVDFTIASKNFSVKYDGYYHDYLCSSDVEESIETLITDALNEKWSETNAGRGGVTWNFNAQMLVPLKDCESDGLTTEYILKNYGKTLTMELTMTGKAVDFATYKQFTYSAIEIIRANLKVCPDFMQVFYYRNETSEPTLQYESRLSDVMFNYEEEGFYKASNVNYIVELNEDLGFNLDVLDSYKKSTIIKIVVISVIGVTVIALGTLWIVRRIKKYKKEHRKVS